MIERFIKQFKEELIFKKPEVGDPILVFSYGSPVNINEIRVGYISELEDDPTNGEWKIFTILFFFPHSKFRIALCREHYMGEVVFKLSGKEMWVSAIKDIKSQVVEEKTEDEAKENRKKFKLLDGGKKSGTVQESNKDDSTE